jgi:two-component system NtrC family sensor kinase
MLKILFIETGGYALKDLEQFLESRGYFTMLALNMTDGLKVAMEMGADIVVVGMSDEAASLNAVRSFHLGGCLGDGILILMYGGYGAEEAIEVIDHMKADVVLRFPVDPMDFFNHVRRHALSKQKGVTDHGLATVLEEVRDFIIMTDEELQEVYHANLAAKEVLGFPEGSMDLAGKWLRELFPKDLLTLLFSSIRDALREGRVWSGETRLVQRDGTRIPVSVQVNLHGGQKEGGNRFVSMVIRDITELKRTQESLERQEAFYRLITENTSDLIGLFDPKGDSIYCSPSYEKILGYGTWQMDGQGLYEFIHNDDRERVRGVILSALSEGKEVFLEYRMVNRNGEVHHLEATTGGIRNSFGRFERLILVSRDITLQVRQREERRLKEMHSFHAQKMESIGQLAAGVAHEMNTPIQYFGDNLHFIRDSISDLSNLLKEMHNRLISLKGKESNLATGEILKEVEELWEHADADFLMTEIPHAIAQSLQGCSNLSQIVSAMKEFSHPGSEEKVPAQLNDIIRNTMIISRNEWKYIADVEYNLEKNLPMVLCLPNEIGQLLLNLVINACHAIEEKRLDSSEKGLIRVSTATVNVDEEKWVELRVEDSGMGMPQEIRNRIFEPFFTTKPVGKGTGQGLAIVHNVVVDKHSGQIHVESEQGQGTTFIVKLPTNTPPQQTETEESL